MSVTLFITESGGIQKHKIDEENNLLDFPFNSLWLFFLPFHSVLTPCTHFFVVSQKNMSEGSWVLISQGGRISAGRKQDATKHVPTQILVWLFGNHLTRDLSLVNSLTRWIKRKVILLFSHFLRMSSRGWVDMPARLIIRFNQCSRIRCYRLMFTAFFIISWDSGRSKMTGDWRWSIISMVIPPAKDFHS